MIHFVGAGPGAPDLITVRGKELLEKADLIIYAGSLVNPALLSFAKNGARSISSASMTLEEVIAECAAAEAKGACTVRLHTGDPSLFGAIREQMDELDQRGIRYEVVPGVSSFCAAAAALNAEYTLPDISQSLVITRAEGRTAVPEQQKIAALAAAGVSMAIFLSASLADSLKNQLLASGLAADTPAAVVYRASWPDEKIIRGTIANLPEMCAENGISKTALILVGNFLGGTAFQRSRLYDPSFTHEYRKGTV